MLKSKKKSTPSRIKYEHSHPTVSFRVSKEIYGRLQAVKEAEGKSITDVLKVGLGLLEVKVSKEKEVRDQAYYQGYDEGYKDAEELYKVTYLCKICRKTIEVMSVKEKEAIKGYMHEHGWAHVKCISRGY